MVAIALCMVCSSSCIVNKPYHSRLGTWLQIRALPTKSPTPPVNGDIEQPVDETQGVPLADLSNATESRVMSQSVVELLTNAY